MDNNIAAALFVSAVFVIAFVAVKVRRNRKPSGPVEDGPVTGEGVE